MALLPLDFLLPGVTGHLYGLNCMRSPPLGRTVQGQTHEEELRDAPTFLLSDSEEVEGGDHQGHQQGTHYAHHDEDTVPVVSLV